MNAKKILIGGGARCGKSEFALRLARGLGERRVFVATAEAGDAEMASRIVRHSKERGPDFRTLEVPYELEDAFRKLKDVDVVVLDCLTLWMSNMLCRGFGEDEILARFKNWAAAARDLRCHLVVVTNEVGLGLVPETPLGRAFRDVAGRAHRILAEGADEVYFGVMGQMLRLKPGPVEVV